MRKLYGVQGGAWETFVEETNALLSTGTTNRRYEEFRRKYRYDPAGFAMDCFYWPAGQGITNYQIRILDELVDRRRIAVRGPHGIGKSAIASMAILWFSLTRDTEDWKIPTTASAHQQLTRYLWPEVAKWRKRLRWSIIGRDPFVEGKEALQRELKLDTGRAFPIASTRPEEMEGSHADQQLFIFDEAKIIQEETFDALEGAFSGAWGNTDREAYAIAISTPGVPSGRFYDIHSHKAGYEDWYTMHVTLEDAIEAGRIPKEWADQRKRQWGENSALYMNRVLGEFCPDDENGVIPLAWIEAANMRWLQWQEDIEEQGAKALGKVTSIGVDMGRGGDKTVFALCFDERRVDKLQYMSNQTMKPVVARAEALLNKHTGAALVPDAIGIGADRFDDEKYKVIPFVASNKTDRKDRSETFGFANMRAAAWWTMREILDPDFDEGVALPPDDILTGDLAAPKWREIAGGKIIIQSKEEIKKDLRRSTDAADAVIQAVVGPDLCRKKRKSSIS